MLQELLTILDGIKVNKRNGKFAVYKPLLLMIIFNEIEKHATNHFSFKMIYPKLKNAMEKYGWPTITPKRAEYPFHFLASSILWETNIDKAELKNKNSPSKEELANAYGKLNQKIYDFLVKHPDSIYKAKEFIHTKYSIPTSID